MAARKNVLIMGAAGQLGRRACEKFMEGNHWYTMGADVICPNAAGLTFCQMPSQGPEKSQQGQHLVKFLRDQLGDNGRLDAVVNLAGGFAMGSAEDPALLATTIAMVESSLYSSIVASYVSSQMLKKEGLLILPGAAAAWSPTAWSLPYGTAKVAVHHLVRSLAESQAAKTIGLAPQILDTVQNREAMPDADVSSWASLEEVAEQIEAWCADPEVVLNGHVYLIDKKPGLKATFEARKPL